MFLKETKTCSENNLQLKSLKCITTDGSKNKCGRNKGVVSLVSNAVENDSDSKPLYIAYSLAVLCLIILDLSEVLKLVVSAINYIRSLRSIARVFFSCGIVLI